MEVDCYVAHVHAEQLPCLVLEHESSEEDVGDGRYSVFLGDAFDTPVGDLPILHERVVQIDIRLVVDCMSLDEAVALVLHAMGGSTQLAQRQRYEFLCDCHVMHPSSQP